MLLDASNGVGQGLSRPERPDTQPVPNDANRTRPERQETGRTSETGGGVVTSFSAAAMELARPVAGVEQRAEMNRSDDPGERENRGVAQANRDEELRRMSEQPERHKSIDLVV